MKSRRTPRRTPESVPMPPPTEEERRQSEEFVRILSEATEINRQRNLNNAVLLAHEAARGEGDLVEHFAELGRRFGHTLGTKKTESTKFRVIEGGAA